MTDLFTLAPAATTPAEYYRRFTSSGERGTIKRLLLAAFRKGYTVSVFDGEVWTVKESSSYDAVIEALATTGEDVLRFRDKNGFAVGKAYLVWGNDPDGSELVSDHTDEPAMNRLISQAGA